MKSFLLNQFFLVFCIGLNAQSVPLALVDSGEFLDVIEVDSFTYIASTDKIIKINPDNSQEVLKTYSLYGKYLKGEFYKGTGSNLWTYVGNQFFQIDYSTNGTILLHYDGVSLTEEYVDVINYSLLGESIKDVSYVSNDSIYFLISRGPNYKVRVFDSDENLLQTIELEDEAEEIILLNDNSHLLVGSRELHLLKDGEVKLVKEFNKNIVDIEYYPLESKFDILLKGEIHTLNENFETTRIKFYSDSKGDPVSIYSRDSIYHIIEVEDDQSYITTYGNGFSSTYEEINGIRYTDMKIINDKFYISGHNLCSLYRYLMKIDFDGVDYDIPTINLELTNYTLDYLGLLNDTTYNSTGDTIVDSYNYYDWTFDVINSGTRRVDSFLVKSNTIRWTYLPIYFHEDEPLLPNESRKYQGELKIPKYIFGQFDYYLWISIGTNALDSECVNNSASFGKLLTSSLDVPKESDIQIYPNPTSAYLNINVDDSYSYRIYTNYGELVSSHRDNNKRQINVSNLNPGMYILEIILYDNKIIKQFVKVSN